jgi:putative ABC transport system substrate-binding protein
MDRRRFLLLALAGALASPPISEGQRAGKVYRIGFISNGGHRTHDPLRAAFLDGLRELGWLEATNLTMEVRWAEGDLRRHPQLTRDLVAREVDVIVVAGTAAARAATEATRTIPIVVTAVGDPVAAGLVSSLARPGGNLTGLAWQASDLVTKQLQLLQEISPADDRLAVLAHASNPSGARAAVEGAARTLGLKFDVFDVDAPAAISAAFERIQRSRATMLLVLPSPMFFAERRRLTELAARHRVPAVYEVKEYVDDGGLLSYGPSFPTMYRRAASFVDRIFRGARPGDLPMEQPTKFELSINVRTARALALQIPPSLLLRADQVVE